MLFYLGRNGQQTGPFTEAEVRAQLAAGTVAGTDLIWREGMRDWLPVASVLGAATTPPPPSQPLRAGGGVTERPFVSSVTREPVEDSPQLAGRGTRLGAVLLDGLVNVIGLGPGLIWMVMVFNSHSMSGQMNGDAVDLVYFTQHLSGPLLAILLPLLIILVVQTWLLCKQGQTLGKLWLKIRIVRTDGSKAGFVHVLLLRSFVMQLLTAIPVVGGLLALVDPLLIFREDRRCIHDLLADTCVVTA